MTALPAAAMAPLAADRWLATEPERVQHRAVRLSRLYTLHPSAVVGEQDSGYHCLVIDVGPRRRSEDSVEALFGLAAGALSVATDSRDQDLP